ncbi:MAG: hypothetical protein ACLR6B_10505 [Blautia sp.]
MKAQKRETIDGKFCTLYHALQRSAASVPGRCSFSRKGNGGADQENVGRREWIRHQKNLAASSQNPRNLSPSTAVLTRTGDRKTQK